MTAIPNQVEEAKFTVVISEKGGGERREAFSQPEVSVGRVQGNELMLPKGNVSKRHARLTMRDRDFIVTDQNSTNGTYVNRRRISQATVVGKSDRIYIGDFVLRIEPAAGFGMNSTLSSVADLPPASASSAPPAEPLEVASSAPLSITPPGAVLGTSSEPPSSTSRGASAPPVGASQSGARADYFSALTALDREVTGGLDARVLDGEISDKVRRKIEKLVRDSFTKLQAVGVIPASIAEGRISEDARSELLDLGPLREPLEDPEVTEIDVTASRSIFVTRSGVRLVLDQRISSEDSVERILRRLCQLAAEPLNTDEQLVHRTLPGAIRLSALRGARASVGPSLGLRRARQVRASVDELVRDGTMSRAMATFLGYCVSARLNILVVGPRHSGATMLVSALAASCRKEHLVTLQDRDQLLVDAEHVTAVSTAASDGCDDAVKFATEICAGRLVVESMTGETARRVLAAVGDGSDGIIAALRASTLRQGLIRLPAELSSVMPGVATETARDWLAGSFHLVVEIARLADGRSRVLRIAEINGVIDGTVRSVDIYSFVLERTATGGALEGSFAPSGTEPSLLEELNARGIGLDSSLFAR